MVNFADIIEDIDYDAFAPVPVGVYPVEIIKAEAKQASTGREMINVQLRIVDGPSKGRMLFNNFVWVPENDKAVQMFFVNMREFGLGKEYFRGNPTFEQLANELLNRRVMVEIEHTEYNGSTREQVKRIKKIEGYENPAPGQGGNANQGIPSVNPTGSAAPASAPAASTTSTNPSAAPDVPF